MKATHRVRGRFP